MYQISRFGKLKSVFRISRYGKLTITEKILKQTVCQEGYDRKEFRWYENGERKKKRVYVHRLVAIAFIPRIKGKNDINHKDGNKLNNHITNLEWCTPRENTLHAIKNNLIVTKKIPDETRSFIKENYDGSNRYKLGKMLNLHPQSIYVIGTNRDGYGGEIRTFPRPKHISRYKMVIDVETGEKYTVMAVSKLLGITIKNTYKIIGQYNGTANTTKYKYADEKTA